MSAIMGVGETAVEICREEVLGPGSIVQLSFPSELKEIVVSSVDQD